MAELRLKGKCALITGAATGIGLATAQRMALEGADLALVDLDEEGLEKAKADAASKGARVMTFRCDVSEEDEVKATVRGTEGKFGKIDILVNNAGIWRRYLPFSETTSDMWKRYIGVNLLGTMYFTRAVVGGMIARGWGRIINIGSVAGVYGNANMADYSATKGAVIAFTKALAKEVTEKGVLVNCVSPGSVSNVQDQVEPSQLSFAGRTGTHTENANLICFLASDEASYISGQNIQIDGCRKKM